MANDRVEQLKRVSIFAGCSKSELQFLTRQMDEVSANAGRTLIVEGTSNHTFYIVLQGELDVTLKGQLIDHLKPGDFFGEISMLDRGKATATVVTTTPAVLLVLSHAQFRDAIKARDTIALKVMAAMAERLRRTMTIA
jgi:CRP-like cAMP-binding protein